MQACCFCIFMPTFASALKNKTIKYVIAIILLLCFTTGQIILSVHSHRDVAKIAKSKHTRSSAPQETCKICHLSQSATALLYVNAVNTTLYAKIYKQQQTVSLCYQSISRLLAATRGPPTV